MAASVVPLRLNGLSLAFAGKLESKLLQKRSRTAKSKRGRTVVHSVVRCVVQTGDSGEIDQHSALKPITIPEESDQASERSDAGFSILLEGDRFRQV